MFLWGHRGCRGIVGIDENTLPAFDWALEHGADGLEFDVQVTSDGVPFVFHDETANRMVMENDNRPIQRMTWHQIRNLVLVEGGRIPALSALAHYENKTLLNLEIKTAEAVPSVLEFLSERRQAQWIVSSFIFEALVTVRQALPNLGIGYLLECSKGESHRDMRKRAMSEIDILGPERVHLDDRLAEASLIRSLKALGVSIYVWTVNDLDRIARLSDFGVAGIFTDDCKTVCFGETIG